MKKSKIIFFSIPIPAQKLNLNIKYAKDLGKNIWGLKEVYLQMYVTNCLHDIIDFLGLNVSTSYESILLININMNSQKNNKYNWKIVSD